MRVVLKPCHCLVNFGGGLEGGGGVALKGGFKTPSELDEEGFVKK